MKSNKYKFPKVLKKAKNSKGEEFYGLIVHFYVERHFTKELERQNITFET